jgi:hypothetical protein
MVKKSEKDLSNKNKKKEKAIGPAGSSIKKKIKIKPVRVRKPVSQYFYTGRRGLHPRQIIRRTNIPIPIVDMTTRTLHRYFPIFCNLFRQRATSGNLYLYTAPPIHYIEMKETGDLTFDPERILSCYNRPAFIDGDFLCYMILVFNYTPGVAHFVAAVKYNRMLYFFNSWGSARKDRFKILDKRILNRVRNYIDERYPNPIQSSIQYNGPALQAATGSSGINVPVPITVNGRRVIAPGGFCGLVSLDFIVLMRLLQSRGLTLTNTASFNRYVSQLGNIGLVAGGRMTSTPISQPNGTALPIARLNQAARAGRGLSYQVGRPSNVTLHPINYISTTSHIPSPIVRNVRKYTLWYESRNSANGYNRVRNNFKTKNDLVKFLTGYKNRGINLSNYSISKFNNPANRKRITIMAGPSTGPVRYRIPFQNLYMNVNDSVVYN